MGPNEVANKAAEVIEEAKLPFIMFVYSGPDKVTGELCMSQEIHSGQLIALGAWLQERGLHIIRKAQFTEERLLHTGNMPLPPMPGGRH